jgi:hypothetical protein
MGPDEGFDFEPTEPQHPAVFDKAAAERIRPSMYAFNMGDAIRYFEDTFPAPEGHEIKFQYLEFADFAYPLIPEEQIQAFLEKWEAATGKTVEIREVTYSDMEEGELSSNVEWLSLPKHEIPEKVKEFVRLVETGTTKEWCRCLWEVHRDHVEIPEGMCTHCREPREHKYHNGGPVLTQADVDEGYHSFRGRGVRIKETRPECPVHVKEGLILGFFEWMFKDAEDVPSTDDAPGEPPATGDGEIPGGTLPTDIPGPE